VADCISIAACALAVVCIVLMIVITFDDEVWKG
jgi:hypothetical protein